MRKLLVVVAILILIMCSCSTTKFVEVPVEVPVEKVRTEYIHGIKIDSVFIRDSVDRWLKGDTLYIYKEHTKTNYINKVDTVCKTDTITNVVKMNVVKEVEVNHIYWYQKALMWVGVVAVLLLTGVILYKIKL